MSPSRLMLRVLVVDDDPVLTDLLVTLLGVLSHDVYAATSGRFALQQLAEAQPIHVVLIDLHMPGMDGESLARAMASLSQPPRLIGMSGAAPTEEQARHFHGFLQKPFSVEDLDQILSGSASKPTSTHQLPAHTVLLDIQIYNRLRAAMPKQQLLDLYARTLANIRELAPSFDTRNSFACRELAHTLQGSCAMVGALELASLAATIAENSQGAFRESPPSYILLRAADRLERILTPLLLP